MTEIYIVTAGDYSSYHVVAAFSSEALAQQVASGVDGEVEAYELDRPTVLPTMPRYDIDLARETGDVLGYTTREALNALTLTPYPPVMYSLSYRTYDGRHPYHLQVQCYARDAAHATKVAAEVRTEVNMKDYWRFLGEGHHTIYTDPMIRQALAEEAQRLLNAEE